VGVFVGCQTQYQSHSSLIAATGTSKSSSKSSRNPLDSPVLPSLIYLVSRHHQDVRVQAALS
jgi:hypothetical protein